MTPGDRLDVLIYGHDGRGLGHVSRSVGVGMALRRLYPDRKVLFVSGCNFSQELIGPAPLDWLKLPSYATRVIGGRSRGVPGDSGFSDRRLGELRARELAHLVALYRPRLVLVDHTPQGKHKELVPALLATRTSDTRWILGVRGVVGAVSQAGSKLGRNLFSRYFHSLLWYGDSDVLGESHLELLRRHYRSSPQECGYVLRLAELAAWNGGEEIAANRPVGTISVPWLGEGSMGVLQALAAALKDIPPELGQWHLFIGSDGSSASSRLRALFGSLPHCRLERPGLGYVASLCRSQVAVIYGGYNSLMDVLHVRVPAVVILREMQDNEQQLHLQRLQKVAGDSLVSFSESRLDGLELARVLRSYVKEGMRSNHRINMAGAPTAAHYLERLLIAG